MEFTCIDAVAGSTLLESTDTYNAAEWSTLDHYFPDFEAWAAHCRHLCVPVHGDFCVPQLGHVAKLDWIRELTELLARLLGQLRLHGPTDRRTSLVEPELFNLAQSFVSSAMIQPLSTLHSSLLNMDKVMVKVCGHTHSNEARGLNKRRSLPRFLESELPREQG
jgi:hypothetical protein